MPSIASDAPPVGAAGPLATGAPRPAWSWMETPRLDLRPLRASDAPAMHAYASQPGFFRFLDHVPERVRAAYTEADALHHIGELRGLSQAGYPHWAIVPRAAGRPVGVVRFHPDPESDFPELGYGIGPAWWGQGLATEACQAALAWAKPHWTDVVARTNPDNLASQAVLRKLGFAAAGTDARGRTRFTRVLRAVA